MKDSLISISHRSLLHLAVLLSLMLTAAQHATAQDTTIRTNVPLVVLSTSAADKHGHTVSGLQASDFLLLDEGKPRPVRVDTVDSGLAPIALVTLIQTTASSLSALAKIKKVGAMIPEAVVGANGEAAVVTFDDEVKLLQDFTTDPDSIAKAFRELKPQDSDGGRMIDAVDDALRLLAHRPGARRANILIIGENKDRGSKEKLADLIPKLQASGATVYSLTYSAYLTPFTTKPEDYQPTGGSPSYIEAARLFKQNTAAALTDVTGGQRLGFETKSKLENDLIKLGSDIHSRYLLSFTPSSEPNSRFHRLQVSVKNHPEAVIRTRPGYWSVTNDSAR